MHSRWIADPGSVLDFRAAWDNMDAAAGTFLSAVFANRRRESRGNSNVRSSLPHQCPNGGIGRRAAFRSQFSQGSGGSSPLSGTNPQTSSLACGCGRVCKYSPQPRKSGLSPAISSSVFRGVVRLVRCRTWSMKRRMDFQRALARWPPSAAQTARTHFV
jgi:hypothetical protein